MHFFSGNRDAKDRAEASERIVNQKIAETHDANLGTIQMARKEVMQSRRIIGIAEQAIETLRLSERQHR